MVRREDQPVLPPQMHRELSGAIATQCVAPPRDLIHLPEGWRRRERGETTLEQLPVVRTPSLPTARVLTAAPFEFPVGPAQFDRNPLDPYNPRG